MYDVRGPRGPSPYVRPAPGGARAVLQSPAAGHGGTAARGLPPRRCGDPLGEPGHPARLLARRRGGAHAGLRPPCPVRGRLRRGQVGRAPGRRRTAARSSLPARVPGGRRGRRPRPSDAARAGVPLPRSADGRAQCADRAVPRRAARGRPVPSGRRSGGAVRGRGGLAARPAAGRARLRGHLGLALPLPAGGRRRSHRHVRPGAARRGGRAPLRAFRGTGPELGHRRRGRGRRRDRHP